MDTRVTEPTTWNGRLFMGTGTLLYWGPVRATAPHAHHAFQVMASLDQPLHLRGTRRDGAVEGQAAVIPPDALHEVTAPSPSVLLLYLDPDGLVGRRLRRALGATGEAVDWMHAGTPLLPVTPRAAPETWAQARQLAQSFVDALASPEARPQVLHPAVQRAVRFVAANLEGDIRLGAVAEHAEISPGRLTHLLPEHVGLPLRPYVAWLRLQRAVARLREGATLTESAHHAGFTDGAHLTRIFRRMFGIRPSDIMGRAEWVLPTPTDDDALAK
ncbi:helix-turn-helix transcriptional regulator [Myxococcus landrumensis]|uniref:Helix-turn-helix transcriptional regulator n=1 Tax=Myxococcus landrumensis TaxID=2813577 RepID=A0ABX7NFS4_9BACT|nr:AraC family transcriptional regulator [Myxococcus landrumus]QSQ17630.1 helix-turn-helix transcriptional regulator [Myxococcus landrumus]